MLEVIILGATLLGGAAALWFFGERIPVMKRLAKATWGDGALEPAPMGGQLNVEREPEYADADEEDWAGRASTTIFGWRMARAFPGSRGLSVFVGEEAVDRLEILFDGPLVKRVNGRQVAPIWWFRAGPSNSIQRFLREGPTRCVIGTFEVDVELIGVWREFDERREFVYVQCQPMDPTGLYPSQISRQERQALREEYAVFGEHLLTVAEYEDGHAIIEGEVVPVSGADRRVRLLSPYNFLVTGKSSPINSSDFDARSEGVLDGLLDGTRHLEELRVLVSEAPERIMDGPSW